MLLSEICQVKPQNPLDEGLKDLLKKAAVPLAVAMAIAAGANYAYDQHQYSPQRIERIAVTYSTLIDQVVKKLERMDKATFKAYAQNVDDWTEEHLKGQGFSGKFDRITDQQEIEHISSIVAGDHHPEFDENNVGDFAPNKYYKRIISQLQNMSSTYDQLGNKMRTLKAVEGDDKDLAKNKLPSVPDMEEYTGANTVLAYELTHNKVLASKLKASGF